jgi:chromate reductase
VPEPTEKIRNADGVLLAVPEYNYSFTAALTALKNIIDWISRIPGQPFAGKPLAMMGASTEIFGTVRVKMFLRQPQVSLNARVINKTEVHAGSSNDKFDADGNLTDDKIKERFTKMVEAFYMIIKKDNRI